jgi:hypothetical protein
MTKKINRFLQLRISSQIRDEINSIARRQGIASADVVRGALYYGLPVLAAMTEIQNKITGKLTRQLKKDARKKSS